MNKIKYFRQKNKMTVRELSEKAEVAIGYLSDLENDSDGSKNPTRDVMIKISTALGQTVPQVFFPDEKLNKEVS